MAYRADILLKQNGQIVHKESKSFDRRTTAKAGMERSEKKLRAPGGVKSAGSKKGTLGDVIRQYIKEDGPTIGRTKTQCLKSILECDIANVPLDEVCSHEDFMQMPFPSARTHASDTPLTDLGGEHWPEAVPPKTNRLMADLDAAFVPQVLDVA